MLKRCHVYFGGPDWDDRWQSDLALPEALSLNEKVLYVPYTCTLFRALKHKSDRRRFAYWLKGKRIRKISKNLIIYYPPPMFHFGYTDPIIRFNEKLVEFNLRFLSHSAKTVSMKLGFNNPIIWTSSSFANCMRKVFPNNLLIYYLVDDYRYYPHTNAKTIEKNEMKNAQICDSVIVISKELKRRFDRYGAKTLLTNIGVTYRTINYDNSISPLSEINDFLGKKIGFLGTLASWVDYSLLEKIADKFSNCQLVFVGPIERNKRELELKSLLDCHNVRCFPTVDISDVPKVIAAFDVCILPFLRNEITLSADPIKMYDYLAGCKPVVAIKINEDMERFREVAYLCDTHEDFLKAIELSLNKQHPDTIRKKQLEFVKNNTWDNIVPRIRRFIDDEFFNI